MKDQEKILHVLALAAHELNEQKITWAVGASMLLYFHGITNTFHDIDLMTTLQDAEKVKNILLKLGAVQENSAANRMYKTECFYEFDLHGVEIDVIAGMIIVCSGREEDCSLQKDKIEGCASLENERIPLYSVQEWRRFYALMGREKKVEMIDQKIGKNIF